MKHNKYLQQTTSILDPLFASLSSSNPITTKMATTIGGGSFIGKLLGRGLLGMRLWSWPGRRLSCDGGEEGVLEYFVAFGYVC